MWISIGIVIGFVVGHFFTKFVGDITGPQNTKVSTPSASHNTGMLANAQICQNIVEDQLDYLIRIGLDFKEGEKDSVRDSLYCIVAGKLQHT